MVKRLVTPAAKRAGTDRLEELRQAIGRNFPSRRETAALWSVVRGFSVEEVKVALDALPAEAGRTVNGEIAGMLYYRWAQLDPEAAATAAAARGNDAYQEVSAVISAWSQSDLDAAIRWAKDSGSYLARNSVVWPAARRWVAEDPATAVSRARAELPESVSIVLRELFAALPAKPDSRPEILAILRDEIPEDSRERYFNSFTMQAYSLGYAQMDDIAADMADAGWPEESVLKFREANKRFQPMEWPPPVLDSPRPETRPEDREAAYRRWAVNQPEQAIEWSEARGESGLVSRTVEVFADNLLASNWSPGRDDNGRTLDAVRKQFAVWQRLDAAAAGAWLAAMPGELRNQVINPAPEDHATR